MDVAIYPFGTTSDGKMVFCCRMQQSNGAWAEVLSYGATLRALAVPNQSGELQSVCYGYDTLQGYENGQDYRGAVVGRCAGRIANATFDLNGKTYTLYANQNNHHLHGGKQGFDRKLWQMTPLQNGVQLYRIAADGEEGYPGAVELTVTYTFTQPNTLCIQFDALPLQQTVLSLTHHGYWNLAGCANVGDHWFSSPATQYAAIQPDGIPTGELLQTQGTPFDFRQPQQLQQHWNTADTQIQAGSGYDHTLLVPGSGLRTMCRLYHPKSGITMQVNSTLPGIHLYTGNFLQPTPRCAVALEAQFIPDAVHHPQFPGVVEEKGEHWQHTIAYQFTCEKNNPYYGGVSL